MATYITFVMDETGSMDTLKHEAISGFNAYLKTIANGIEGRTSFSMLKFDSTKLEWFVKNKPLKDVPKLNGETYCPGAMTPLWDAIAHAIKETEKRVKGKKKPTIIFTVLTDGYENHSREHTSDQVKEMIEGHDNWAFNFVGAGIDVWHITTAIGVHAASAVSTPSTAKGMSAGLRAAGGSSVAYASASPAQQTSMRTDSGFYGGKETAEEVLENLSEE